jgi:hypothetical protein
MANFFKTFLKPSESVMVSLATGAIVYAVYQGALPSIAESHATEAHNGSIESGRKKAVWTSAGVVGAMFLLTHDPNVFMIGAGATVLLDWMHRHANSVNPATGKMVHKTQATTLSGGADQGMSYDDTAPDYVPEYFG